MPIQARPSSPKPARWPVPDLRPPLRAGLPDGARGLVSGASSRTLAAGDFLFHMDSRLRALYLVEHGALKTACLDPEGNERVVGFHLAGDLAGLDAIHTRRHPCCASALVESRVCCIPFASLLGAMRRSPALSDWLMACLSQALAEAEFRAGDHNVRERLAAFLLDLSARNLRQGRDPRQIHMPMSRRDVASYLHMAHETVSRALRQLHEKGLIRVHGSRLYLHDPQRLRQLAPLAPGG